jgi:hypothetical protein
VPPRNTMSTSKPQRLVKRRKISREGQALAKTLPFSIKILAKQSVFKKIHAYKSVSTY